MVGGLVTRFLTGASKKALVVGGGLAATGGAVATADISANGGDGYFGGAVEWFNRALGEGGARAKFGVLKESLYSFVHMIGEVLMDLSDGKFGKGLVDFAERSRSDKGKQEIAPSEQNLNNGQTLAINQENAPSIDNLVEGIKNITPIDLIEKPTLFGLGAWNEVVTAGASALGHIGDGIDWVGGKAGELVDYDTGYKSRDLSKIMRQAAEVNLTAKPELTTAWDRVAYGAGTWAPYVIPTLGPASLATKAAVTGGLTAAGMARDFDMQ